jgi:hypothetical protein
LESGCKSQYLSFERVNKLLTQILGDDKSNLANEARLGCFAALPDQKVKQGVWVNLINPKSKMSLSEKEAQIHEFNQPNQFKILQPYQDEFFGNLIHMYQTTQYKFFKSYFNSLLPRMFEIEVARIDKLISVRQEYTHLLNDKVSPNDPFVKLITNGIELMQRSKKIRDFASHAELAHK